MTKKFWQCKITLHDGKRTSLIFPQNVNTYTPVEAENKNNETRNYQQLSQEGAEWIKNTS